jgi:hypothetical protein
MCRSHANHAAALRSPSRSMLCRFDYSDCIGDWAVPKSCAPPSLPKRTAAFTGACRQKHQQKQQQHDAAGQALQWSRRSWSSGAGPPPPSPSCVSTQPTTLPFPPSELFCAICLDPLGGEEEDGEAVVQLKCPSAHAFHQVSGFMMNGGGGDDAVAAVVAAADDGGCNCSDVQQACAVPWLKSLGTCPTCLHRFPVHT